MSDPVTADRLLTVSQAARLLGVHANTIRAWTDSGRLPAYRINERGDRRYRAADVRALLVEEAGVEGEPEAPDAPAATALADRPALDGLARLTDSLAGATLPAGVAAAAVAALREQLGVERMALYTTASDDATLELGAHAGYGSLPRTLPIDEPGRWPTGLDMVTIPLRARRDVVGLLILDPATAAAIPEPLRASLTATIASHLANARLLVRARLEVRRARALRSVTRELTENLDFTRVVDDIVERARAMFAADRAGIWLFDGPHPIPLVTRNLSAEFLRRSEEITPNSEAIGVRAMSQRRTLWMRNAHLDAGVGELRDAYAAEGIHTVCLSPLVSHGRGVGIIGLYHDRDRTWPEEELELAQAFADQAAVAIQNARLYRSAEEHAARMRSIQDLSARLNRLTDVGAIAEAIVDEARTIAVFHDIRVYRVDHERGVCEPIAFTREMLGSDRADAVERLRLQIGEGFTGWVAQHGEPLLINNALDDPRGKTIEGTDDIPESLLVVPMLYEGRTLGVIVLSQEGFDRFSQDDLQIVSIFAGYAAQAMANASSYGQLTTRTAELARRAESQRKLLEVNQRLLWTLETGDVLESIASGLNEVVPHDNISIYRADHARQVMVPVLVHETYAEAVTNYEIPFGSGLMGWALDHHQAVLANDALTDPRAMQVPGTPAEPEALIIVPLVTEGEVLGALNMSRLGGPEVYFTEDDFQLVQLFSAQASIALRNAEAHHAMSRRAETDALTGLANHGAFQRDLARATDANHGATEPVAVLMLDLDRFKAYNDHHGHPAGDALLEKVADAIRSTGRAEDGVYRYGGDEFAVILPGTDPDGAVVVGERLRLAVDALTQADPMPVTVTVGIGAMPRDAHDRASLVAAADAALYYGKRTGGDRLARADELPRRRRSDLPREGLDAA